MTTLIKRHNDFFNDVFPAWCNWDHVDNYLTQNDPWTAGLTQRSSNKYRWNETDDSYTLDIVMPGMVKQLWIEHEYPYRIIQASVSVWNLDVKALINE